MATPIRQPAIKVPMITFLLFLPLLSGQPLLSGHSPFPQGWPFNRGSTVFTPHPLLPTINKLFIHSPLTLWWPVEYKYWQMQKQFGQHREQSVIEQSKLTVSYHRLLSTCSGHPRVSQTTLSSLHLPLLSPYPSWELVQRLVTSVTQGLSEKFWILAFHQSIQALPIPPSNSGTFSSTRQPQTIDHLTFSPNSIVTPLND